MKKINLIIVLVLTIIVPEAYSQKLWEIYQFYPEELDVLGSDTSAATLQQIVADENSDGLYYRCAAKYLAFYHYQEQKDFLLNNLNTSLKLESSDYISSDTWWKYETDQLIRGYFGDESALAGMDTIINYDPSEAAKLLAISKLAEANQYNHYQYAKELFINDIYLADDALPVLGQYGTVPEYRSEITVLLENYINSLENHEKIIVPALCLNSFNSDKAKSIVNDFFENSTGNERYSFFVDLFILDPEGQPERSIRAISTEADENIRSYYIPLPSRARNGKISQRYIMPFFIKFIQDWQNTDTSSVVNYNINQMLKNFFPVEPFSTMPINEMLDTLNSYTLQAYNYNWLKDESYKNELKERVESAEGYLFSSSDQGDAAREIKRFQLSVEQVHADSAGSYPKYVSYVGYKFLYYYSQYVLNRLPEGAE